MNYKIISNYLGKILLLEAICMVPSLLIAIFADGMRSVLSFAVSIAAAAAVGALMLFVVKPKTRSIYSREGCVIVALSWVIISIFGALPMTLSGAIPSYIDAVFETVSGFTTTGATILTDIEVLPMSVLYWRSFTHWLGGMGVLIFILALAPDGHGNGMPFHIMRAESPVPVAGKLAPKLHLTARILYSIYFALTVIQTVILMFGGMPLFDAVTASFSTAGTGGFSIKNDSFASYSPFCQTTLAIFMLLFGVNFNIYFLLIMREFRRVWKNSELRLYLLLVFGSTAAITINTLGYFKGAVGEAWHHSFFQVASIITTTGGTTLNYDLWPEFSHEILLLLMVVGACAGSTGGGVKVSRVVIMWKSFKNEINKLLHPHSVYAIKMDGDVIERGTVSRCGVFFFVYLVLVAISTVALSLDGNSLETNFSAVLACINNVGPGFGRVGPIEAYNCFSAGGKLLLSLNMLFGRLGIFPILLLFVPSTWNTRK